MRKQRNWNDDEKQNKGRITRIRKKIRNKMIIKQNKTRKIKKIRKIIKDICRIACIEEIMITVVLKMKKKRTRSKDIEN